MSSQVASYPAFPGFPAPPMKALAYRNGRIIDYDLQKEKVRCNILHFSKLFVFSFDFLFSVSFAFCRWPDVLQKLSIDIFSLFPNIFMLYFFLCHFSYAIFLMPLFLCHFSYATFLMPLFVPRNHLWIFHHCFNLLDFPVCGVFLYHFYIFFISLTSKQNKCIVKQSVLRDFGTSFFIHQTL